MGRKSRVVLSLQLSLKVKVKEKTEMSSFRKASKKASRLRMALCSPPGGGKTFTALRFAMALTKTGRVAVINTESGAVEKYLGLAPDGTPFLFDIAELPDFSPTRYTQFIQEAGREGYDVILIDSLSHAWAGSGGALELKDKKGGNSFTAWKDITPMHNAMIEAILRSPAHIIATMRTKVAYVLEEQTNQKTGATIQVPKKIGMEPIQRQGMEYEFDIVADLDQTTHTLTVTKSRCPAVDGLVVVKPGAEFVRPVIQWLEEGVEVAADFYAVKPEDLKAVQQETAAATDAAATIAAEQERKRQLLAMADEKPPFEPTGMIPPGSTPPTVQPTTATVQAEAAHSPDKRIVLSNELVAIGAEIGRTPQQINDQCKAKFNGQGVRDIPFETLEKLVAAFRTVRDQAKAAAGAPSGNPTAA